MSGNSLTVAAARTRGVWDHAGLGLFDRFTAFIGLILVAPVFLVLAVAIVIDSGFPVFFSQERLGVGGRLFRMYKFRKFAADISWETEVWIANAPDHLVHFNGDSFMGPHNPKHSKGHQKDCSCLPKP